MLRISKFSARWISTLGLSIGINDVTPFDYLNQAKSDLLKMGFDKCDKMIEKFKEGSL